MIPIKLVPNLNLDSCKNSIVESKNTKILNSEENSKRKIKNQKAKSKVQTHQTNG